MPPPRYLLDRSLGGRKLVTALRSAGWDAITLAEMFGDVRAQRDARVIAFARGDITAEDMTALCLTYAPQIHRYATVAPPFVMSLSQRGLRRKHLNWPVD